MINIIVVGFLSHQPLPKHKAAEDGSPGWTWAVCVPDVQQFQGQPGQHQPSRACPWRPGPAAGTAFGSCCLAAGEILQR